MAEEKTEEKKERRPTALKRRDQAEKRRVINKAFRSKVKTAIKGFEDSSTLENLSIVYSLMDKGVKKGIFKLNKANRTKSRIAAKFPQ